MFHVHLGVVPRSASVRLLVKFPRLFRERAPVTGLGLPGAAADRAGVDRCWGEPGRTHVFSASKPSCRE